MVVLVTRIAASVDVAVFDKRSVSTMVWDRMPVRATNLLAPVLAWCVDPYDGWEQDCTDAINSDPGALNRLIDRSGGTESVLTRLGGMTGVVIGGHGPVQDRWITAGQVADLYRVFWSAQDRHARQVRAWMGGGEDTPWFRLVTLWGTLTHQWSDLIGFHASWDLCDGRVLNTHVVLTGPEQSGVIVTAVPLTVKQATLWRRASASRDQEAVIELHKEWAAGALSEGVLWAAARRPPREAPLGREDVLSNLVAQPPSVREGSSGEMDN